MDKVHKFSDFERHNPLDSKTIEINENSSVAYRGKQIRGLSPRMNYADRATAASRRS
jgi:hypothetical protein